MTYGSWDRQRAILTQLCLEVYVSGVTDQAASEPGSLEVFALAHIKYSARFLYRKGNNWVYGLNLRDFDPRYGRPSENGNTALELDMRFYSRGVLRSFAFGESEPVKLRIVP